MHANVYPDVIKVEGHLLCFQIYLIIDPLLNQRYQRPGVCVRARVCVCDREGEGEREGESFS